MTRLEAVTLGAGSLLVVAALALVDLRLGIAAAGVFLVLSSIDIPWRRP